MNVSNITTVESILLVLAAGFVFRIWTPWGARTSGNIVKRQALSLFGRLRMHGQFAALVLAGSAIVAASGRASWWILFAEAAIFAFLIALPMHYTLTSQGIRAGRTPFRRWTEFGGVARRLGGVRLQGVAGARPLTVWLSGGRDDDDFVLLLRQLVRGSYKGELGPEASAPPAGATPGTVQIVGVGGS